MPNDRAQRTRTAADHPEPVSGDFTIRDLKFASGEAFPELRIYYRTVGTPRKEMDVVVRNVVLVLHGTTGSPSGRLIDSPVRTIRSGRSAAMMPGRRPSSRAIDSEWRS